MLGRNGAGKSILCDALIFTLSTDLKALRLTASNEAINSALREQCQASGTVPHAITQVGFVLPPSDSFPGQRPQGNDPSARPVAQVLCVRRRVEGSGSSTWYQGVLEASEFLDSAGPSAAAAAIGAPLSKSTLVRTHLR